MAASYTTRGGRRAIAAVWLIAACGGGRIGVGYQAAPPKPQTVAPVQTTAPASPPLTPPLAAAPVDAALLVAEELVGKALFVRGFYMGNDLGYTTVGKVEGTPKAGDWTLAAMNVLKAMRRSPTEIELEGVRVAIRYNPDAHEFQRHPQNDTKMKMLLQVVPGDASTKQLREALESIFAVGIDPALQRSLPPLWRHYFDPAVAWPDDGLAGQTVYPMYGLPDQPKDVTPPLLAHKVDATIPEFALRDKVKGTAQMRLVVDAGGVPQHIAVTRPLGYGLDERAAEAVVRWRFTPAMRAGKAVASGIVVNLDFE